MRVVVISLSLTILVISAKTMFYPKMLTRFCYNSPDPSRVNSQCIYCNYFSFDNTILGCTGSSAVTINMTATQAFCVIAQCLGQIRQLPVFLGRKRRSLEDEDTIHLSDEDYDQDGEVKNHLEQREKEDQLISNYFAAQKGASEDGLEQITFYLNGKREQFYVAKQVEATVDDFPLEDDLIFEDRKS